MEDRVVVSGDFGFVRCVCEVLVVVGVFVGVFVVWIFVLSGVFCYLLFVVFVGS